MAIGSAEVLIAARRMADHRFKIGQMVFYHPKLPGVDAPTNRPFQITMQLPSPDDGEPLYRIRSPFEEHERVASESELRPVQAYT